MLTKRMLKDAGPSQRKAKEMLQHGTVRGKPLSPRQRGFFGLIASGIRPTKGE